jgi:uncharacterized damage-inducible protein DinB
VTIDKNVSATLSSGSIAVWRVRSRASRPRLRLQEAIAGLTEERANRRCRFGWGEASYLELLLYSLRHIQHHVGQLNLVIRQMTGSAPRWVALG